MVLMWPRRPGLQLLEETYINESNVQALTQAAEDCWKAILNKDLQAFAQAYRASFEAQIRMFPAMISPEITEVIDTYKDQVMAWKMPGAGGGGYLAFVCEQPLPNSIRIKIRRKGL